MTDNATLTYLASLPRTRGAACALLLDPGGRAVVVKPTYRPGWLLPGGVIEKDESPLAACHREVMEELGIAASLAGIIGVDWIPPRDDRDASTVFVFGGRVEQEQLAEIRLPPEELSEHRWVDPHQAFDLLSPHIARRFRACLAAQRERRTVYLEHGHLPRPRNTRYEEWS